ncbi:MAG: dephospho-CoA kinase [Actinobacteria bacterium]|nr:dephospho-CoA kinase [Actinomycetota bacterium]
MLRAFERHGAAVISSDEIVHRFLREDSKVKAAIVERLGEGVLSDDGEIDRGRVAETVFGDPEALAWLESLLHPRVVATYLKWREDLAERQEPPAVCVTEVPLLYEVGGETRFDAVIAVTASPEVRASRARRPLDERETRLLPDDEKLRRADFAYVNDGTRKELDRFVSDVMGKLDGP